MRQDEEAKALLSATKSLTVDGNSNSVDEQLLCIICGLNPKNIALLPCGHMCTCSDCIGRVVTESKKCPLCMYRIQTFMKVYM